MLLYIDWSKLLTIISNLIFTSIPEEIFLVVFTLKLLKQFDLTLQVELVKEYDGNYKEYRKMFLPSDIQKISVIVLVVAVLSNILRYSGVDSSTILLTSIFSMYSSILILYRRYKGLWDMLKTFLFTILSFTVLMVIEFSYIPLVLYATGRTIEDVNNSLPLNILLSLPERIIQYAILMFMFFKKASFSQLKLVHEFLNNKVLTVITIVIICFNVALLIITGKIIGFDKVLVGLNFSKQILITILVLLFPIFNIVTYLCVIYYILNRETYKRFILQQKLKLSVSDIKFYLQEEKYGKAMNELDLIDKHVNELYYQKGCD